VPEALVQPTLSVMFHRDGLLVVDKPSGVLVHNSEFTRTREATMVSSVRAQYGSLWSPVHRLDRGTSGVLLFAEGTDRIHHWQQALASETADKRYLALVRGVVREPIDVDHPVADECGVRHEARSRIEPVWSLDEPRCSLVRVRVFTGRTHQVRRHCHHLSHHVLGDANYGKGALNREYRARFGLARLALHAERIVCDGMTFETPMPDDLLLPIGRMKSVSNTG
jgi:tRNA pseudouridine65 synthase